MKGLFDVDTDAIPDVPTDSSLIVGPPPKVSSGTSIFTDDEVKSIAVSQGVTVDLLSRRWIVGRGNSFYVIGRNGEYMTPVYRTDLAVSLPRDLCRVRPAPADAGVITDGSFGWDKIVRETKVMKSVDEILRDHSTVARQVIATMIPSHSYYDPMTHTFYERICPLRRDLFAEFNPTIDRWMRLLGGDRQEQFLDWVAVIPRTDRPVCAAYIWGPTGTGKTMFANGVARLFSSGPTSLASVVGSFNSAMAENPIIFADEEIHKDATSGFFRHAIGQDVHDLRRKNIPDAKVHGHYRYIIAVNGPDLLRFDEDLTPESVEAIASRFLYVHADLEAAKFLRSIGGIDGGTAGWVSGDQIARHVLWLAANRNVVSGPRFLVSGNTSDMYRRVAIQGSIRPLIVEWMARAMVHTWPALYGKAETRGIQFGQNCVYVNASFIKDSWQEVLGKDARVPSLAKIGRAIGPLTKADPEGRDVRRLRLGDFRADFHSIDPEVIYDASRSMQISTVRRFKDLIRGPRAYLEISRDEDGGDAVNEKKSTVSKTTLVDDWKIPDLPDYAFGGD